MNSSLASSSSTCSSSSSMDCLSSESSEETELPYGPGIVARLKNRFMKYSMNTDATSYRNGGHAIACTASKVQSRRNALNRHNKLKRCSSVENILDDDQQQQQQHDQQESDTSNSPVHSKHLMKQRPPFQTIHHSTAPVIKNYFFKSDSPATSSSTEGTPDNESTALISPVNCNPLPTERCTTSTSTSTSSSSSTSTTVTSHSTDCTLMTSGNKQPEMSQGITSNVSKSPAAINGTPCPTADVRGDASTLITDECISSNTVKKAKSMDSLEFQSSQCNEVKDEKDDDVSTQLTGAAVKKDDMSLTKQVSCDSRPPQVPERTSIRQNVREAAKTAVISPVVKVSCELDTTNESVTCTVDSGSGSGTPSSAASNSVAPVASTRRRSLTRGTTLPSVKPVIAQKPKSSSEVSPVAPVVSKGAPMTQRPIPPPRAQRTLVASVSPLPLAKTGNLPIETKSVTNSSQSTVTPPQPQPQPQLPTACSLSSTSSPQPPPPLVHISPSASTTCPLIATTVASNDCYRNNRNTRDNNNIKNSESGHSSSITTGAVVSSVKSPPLTSTNASSGTMAAYSLPHKANMHSNGEVNNAQNCNFNNNMTSNGANNNNNKILHSNEGSNSRNISSSHVSTMNNINSNNSNGNSNSNGIVNGRCNINGNRSRANSSDNTPQQQAHLQSKASSVSPFPLIITHARDNVESKASIGRSSVINSSNCLVFDFRGKNVQPALAVTSPRGLAAFIDAASEEDEYRGCMDIPAPCNIIFVGENEIIGAGSLLRRRDKNLKITFDDTATETYEYPSEQSLLASDDTENAKWDSPRSGSGNLASYQPAFIGIGSFELGITKTSARITTSANSRPEQKDLPLMRGTPIDDTNPWSKTSGAGPDLLF